ncbi:unnamed protein product [Prunus brigantina]
MFFPHLSSHDDQTTFNQSYQMLGYKLLHMWTFTHLFDKAGCLGKNCPPSV